MGEAAAKEPTMEDILSSIRKIIAEEGEPKTGSAHVEPTMDQPVDLPRESHAETMSEMPSPSVSEASAAEPASITQTVAEPEPVAEVEEAPASLREIAERVAAASSSSQDRPPEQPSDVQPEPEPARTAEAAPSRSFQTPPVETSSESKYSSLSEVAASVASAAQPAEESRVAAPMPSPTTPDPVASVDTAPVEQEAESVTPDVMADNNAASEVADNTEASPVMHAEPPQSSEPVAETQADIEEPVESVTTEMIENEASAFKGALMSPSSDAKVSDSFERLKRSVMDEMEAKTEAVLRPMLREWLDENLPNMVERMVREEIERVARG